MMPLTLAAWSRRVALPWPGSSPALCA